ncbi:IS4 family transposase [soil metagenome]
MNNKQQLIDFTRQEINKLDFINHHKSAPHDFTRERVFNFALVFILLLQKSVKSLQLVLNELFVEAHIKNTVTSSAYSQVRKKFKHTAFIALNEKAIELYYSGNQIKRWKGYRVFGVDASRIILPNHAEIKAKFGDISIKNQHGERGHYSSAMFECRYDVLNHIAYQSELYPSDSYEVDLALEFLKQSVAKGDDSNDLDIYDRGYASYKMVAHLMHYKRDFVIRCKANTFKEAASLFAGEGDWSKAVKLNVPQGKQNEIQAAGLPTEVEVRFVSVVLDTGEIEVLITSLMGIDLEREDFKTLYFLRWGVESFYHLLKGRLNLENFTGKSLESVMQDFWSSIYISNVETIFTEDIEEEINAALKPEQLSKKINKAVSFNAIKNLAFQLFFYEEDKTIIEEKLTQLFKTNTLVQREGRSSPRNKFSWPKAINFQKRNRINAHAAFYYRK